MTDKQLLKKLKKDKDSGLSLIIDLYSGLLYKIAANVILPVGTYEDIEECVSDSLLAFYGEIEGLDLERASIKAYLALITKRKAIDALRRLRASASLTQDTESAEAEVTPDFSLDYDRKVLLWGALKSLGEPDTTIITRKYLLGETAADIARTMNMSEGAVQKRIERGRQKLRLELGGVLNG